MYILYINFFIHTLSQSSFAVPSMISYLEIFNVVGTWYNNTRSVYRFQILKFSTRHSQIKNKKNAEKFSKIKLFSRFVDHIWTNSVHTHQFVISERNKLNISIQNVVHTVCVNLKQSQIMLINRWNNCTN